MVYRHNIWYIAIHHKTEVLPIQGNSESRLDQSTSLEVVVDVPPAAAYNLADMNDRRSVSDIPGSKRETAKRSHNESSPNLRPCAPVSSWMMGCRIDAGLAPYKVPPTLVAK